MRNVSDAHNLRLGVSVLLGDENLELIRSAGEVRIETRRGDRARQTVIWVGVADGVVMVRSVRGDSGRWYQRALANPEVSLLVGDRRFDLIAVPVTDPDTIERASDAFRAKYPKGGSLDSMLRPQVLHTTLILEPRSG